MDVERRSHSIGWPLLLIAAGILFLLNNIGLLPGNIWDILVRFWPVFLIVIGLDNLVQGEGLVGALFIAGIGVVFLLNNLGILAVDVWGTIIRFWPVLIIAAGFDVLLGRRGRRSPWAIVAGVILFVVLFGSLLWFSSQNSPIARIGETQTINQNMDEIQTAVVDVDAIAGSLLIHPTTQIGSLVNGQVHVNRGEDFTQTYQASGTQGVFRLISSGWAIFPSFDNSANSGWDLGITREIPVDLNVSLPVGSTNVDLSGMQVSELNVETVIGQNIILLPVDGDFQGKIENVIGQTIIRVPEGTPVRLHVDSALTSVQTPDSFSRSGDTISSPEAAGADAVIDLDISQTMGGLTVEFAQQ